MKNGYICLCVSLALMAVALPARAGNDFLTNLGNSLLSGGKPATASASSLSNTDIASGLKEALRIGTEKVVGSLGKTDGFNLDPKIHIPLPATLQKVDKALTAMGMGGMTDDLELRINRAAEAATPKAKQLFINSIHKMTINDARAILTGPNDSATQYLKKTMSPELSKEMQPLVQKALAEAGAVKAYSKVVGQYEQLPFVSGIKDNLNNYVVDKAMAGIFYYVAQEEAAIRQNPAKRTTDILKRVFSSVR